MSVSVPWGKVVVDLLEYRGLQEEYVCAAAHWQSINAVAILRIDLENIVQKKYVCTKGKYEKGDLSRVGRR